MWCTCLAHHHFVYLGSRDMHITTTLGPTYLWHPHNINRMTTHVRLVQSPETRRTQVEEQSWDRPKVPREVFLESTACAVTSAQMTRQKTSQTQQERHNRGRCPNHTAKTSTGTNPKPKQKPQRGRKPQWERSPSHSKKTITGTMSKPQQKPQRGRCPNHNKSHNGDDAQTTAKTATRTNPKPQQKP